MSKIIQSKLAIIGGGPGGLYSALRLLESDTYTKEEIVLFEANSYIGGRVRTLPLENLPFTADIGAMRYIPKRQMIINSLVDYLELKTDNHDTPVFSYYLRMKTLYSKTKPGEKIKMSQKDITKALDGKPTVNYRPIDQNAYFLGNEIEHYLHPSELVVYAILKAFNHITIDEPLIRKEYNELSSWITDTDNKIEVINQLLEKDIHESNADYSKRIRQFIMESFNFDYFKFNEWQIIRNAARYRNVYLYDTCLFKILQQELSPEAVVLSEDALGYNTIFAAANAAEHISWFLNDFHVPTYHSIKNGMSRLTYKLEKRIDETSVKKDWKYLNHKLITVKKDEARNLYILKFHHKGEIVICETEKVIFSVSKGALERVNFTTEFNLNKGLKELSKNNMLSEAVECVTSYPLLKAFMFFEKNWYWDNLNDITKGVLKERNKKWNFMNFIKDEFVSTRIISDLPIRQIFFYGASEKGIWRRTHNINEDQKNGIKGMIMAYGDSKKAELWASLAGLKDKDSCHINNAFQKLYSEGLEETRELHGASKSFVDMLTRNLELVFKDSVLEYPKGEAQPAAVFIQDWNKGPFYGGWHAWCASCKPWNVREAIQKPFENENIFICGEAFSADQGWIEGAFRTSEALLKNHFNLSAPKWYSEEFIKGTSLCQEYSDLNKDEMRKKMIDDYIDW